MILCSGLTAQLQHLPTFGSVISGVLIIVLITFLPNGLLGGARTVLQRLPLRRADR